MRFAPYFVYVAVLTFIHHALLFLLEALQFAGLWYFVVKTFLSLAISLFLILIIELLFVRKQKFRTNTA
jgi:membrane protein YdbS with pleckstrin-like domain